MDIYPARIPKAPDFWHPQNVVQAAPYHNNQTVTNDALEIINNAALYPGGTFL